MQVEYFSKGNRGLSYITCGMVSHTLHFILPLIAYLNRDYRLKTVISKYSLIFSIFPSREMHLWAGLIGCLSLPMYFYVPESVHWLACNDRVKEAEQQLYVNCFSAWHG